MVALVTSDVDRFDGMPLSNEDGAATRCDEGRLQLRLLGGFECRSRGEDVRFEENASVAPMLLAYLAMMRRARTSELLALFWPDMAASAADRELRRIVMAVTRRVGMTWVTSTADCWEANPGLDSDAQRFREACARGEYAGALQAYAGPFLRGGPIGVSAPFRVWAMSVRAEASERYTLVSHRLALLRTADALGHGAVFTDRDGCEIAGNRAYRTWVAGTPELREAVHAWVATTRWPLLGMAAEPLRVRISASGLLFDAIGECVASEQAESTETLIQVRPASDIEAGDSPFLDLRFRLTEAQGRIARLIAMGLGNSEIATRLGLSPHTVRHHTEQVLSKLNVKSRAGVAAALSGIRRDGITG